MESLTEIRGEAARINREQFLERHPAPVLVRRESVEGDMQFADPNDPIAKSRLGNTMVHVPHMTAAERIHGPRAPDRKAVEETYASLYVERLRGQKLPTLTVGRARECHIRVNDFTVSDHHCTLYPIATTDRVFVSDNDSRNGTVHNGEVLEREARRHLLSGDELQVGRFVFLFLNGVDFYSYLRGEL